MLTQYQIYIFTSSKLIVEDKINGSNDIIQL